MTQTRIEEGIKYRARQRDAMGDLAYKASEARKRKERRQRAQPASATPTPVAMPEIREEKKREEKKVVNPTLEGIFEAKKLAAEASGHTIKKASVEAAFKRIQKIHEHMTGDPMTNFRWVKDTKKLADFIMTSERWKSDESKIQQFQSLASILKVLKGFEKEYSYYSAKSVSLRKAKDSIDDENKVTDRERDNILPWPDIYKLNNKAGISSHDAALIAIYTLIPPRRAKDYGLMKLSQEAQDPDFNYLVLSDRGKPIKLVFLNFKTASTFGRQEFKIQPPLALKLQEYITAAALATGDFLFGKTKASSFASFSPQVSKVFKTHTGKSVSVNLLRHSFVSHYLTTQHSLAEKKEVAAQMAQSVLMQLKYDRLDISG